MGLFSKPFHLREIEVWDLCLRKRREICKRKKKVGAKSRLCTRIEVVWGTFKVRICTSNLIYYELFLETWFRFMQMVLVCESSYLKLDLLWVILLKTWFYYERFYFNLVYFRWFDLIHNLFMQMIWHVISCLHIDGSSKVVIYMYIEFYILNYVHANINFIWCMVGDSDIGMFMWFTREMWVVILCRGTWVIAVRMCAKD